MMTESLTQRISFLLASWLLCDFALKKAGRKARGTMVRGIIRTAPSSLRLRLKSPMLYLESGAIRGSNLFACGFAALWASASAHSATPSLHHSRGAPIHYQSTALNDPCTTSIPCSAPFAPFRGKSSQVPFREQLAIKNQHFKSGPVRTNQG